MIHSTTVKVLFFIGYLFVLSLGLPLLFFWPIYFIICSVIFKMIYNYIFQFKLEDIKLKEINSERKEMICNYKAGPEKKIMIGYYSLPNDISDDNLLFAVRTKLFSGDLMKISRGEQVLKTFKIKSKEVSIQFSSKKEVRTIVANNLNR